MSNRIETHPSPDLSPGVHLFSGVLLGLTAPSTAMLLLLAAGLLLPGLRLASHRSPLLLGLGVGWCRARALPEEQRGPPSWDRRIPPPPGVLDPLRRRIQRGLSHLEEGDQELTAALVLGSRLGKERKEEYARAGILHLAAQSGLHVGLCFGLVLALLPEGKHREALGLTGALGYTILAGARPSALRACSLLALHQLCRRRGLPGHPLGLLAATGLVFLLVDPGCLGDVGALLSFAATYGILHLGPWCRPRLPGRIPRRLGHALGVSLGATLGSLPVTLTCFGRLPLLAPLVNLVAIPLGSLLIPMALGIGAIGVASPWLAAWLAPPLTLLRLLLDSLAGFASDWLPVLEVPLPPALALGLGAIGLHHLASGPLRPRGTPRGPWREGPPTDLRGNGAPTGSGTEGYAASSSDS